MKKIKLIHIFLVITLLLASGCKNNTNISNNNNNNLIDTVNGDSMENNITSNSSANMVPDDFTLVFNNEIVIYKITRDVFQSFLTNSLHSTLENSNISKKTYFQSGGQHTTYNVTLFPVKPALIDFLGTKAEVQKYLESNGINEDLNSMAIIDSPNVPITLWVKTTTKELYITISYKSEISEYVYECFSKLDYIQKYSQKNGKLLVNGQEILTYVPPKIFYKNADIPLLEAIKALGAKVSWEDNNTAIIFYNNELYRLNLEDCSLYHLRNTDTNLLYQVDGGPTFIYESDKELMIDESSFSSLLNSMGQKIILNIDYEKSIVTLDSSAN